MRRDPRLHGKGMGKKKLQIEIEIEILIVEKRFETGRVVRLGNGAGVAVSLLFLEIWEKWELLGGSDWDPGS